MHLCRQDRRSEGNFSLSSKDSFMKVWMNQKGPLGPLYRHFNLEGISCTQHKVEADLILSDPIQLPQVLSKDSHSVLKSDAVFSLSWIFQKGTFLPQTLLTIPVFNLMNNNLGPVCIAACGTRYVELNNKTTILHDETLLSTLRNLNYTGFISMVFDEGTCHIVTQVPWLGLFSALEGLRCKISDWFRMPEKLWESWGVSMMLSTPPFPLFREADVRITINEEVANHIWLFPAKQSRENSQEFTTTSSQIAIVTGSSSKLFIAADNALAVADGIQVKDKQYRTDIGQEVKRKWMEIREYL